MIEKEKPQTTTETLDDTCPFCGGGPVKYTEYYPSAEKEIECNGCGCLTLFDVDLSKDKALTLWRNATWAQTDASQQIEALQAELAACQAMAQRLATESGESVAWALKMAVQSGSIQLTPLNFQGWDDGCDCAECEQQRAVYAWLFGKGGPGR